MPSFWQITNRVIDWYFCENLLNIFQSSDPAHTKTLRSWNVFCVFWNFTFWTCGVSILIELRHYRTPCIWRRLFVLVNFHSFSSCVPFFPIFVEQADYNVTNKTIIWLTNLWAHPQECLSSTPPTMRRKVISNCTDEFVTLVDYTMLISQ